MIIAIDGPAASGKGTVAKAIAAHYGLEHLDTGLLYRATAAAVRKMGAAADDAQAGLRAARELKAGDLADTFLRNRHIGELASIIAAFPAVREALITMQRDFAARETGAVLDGRDIGTFICPDADVKLFVTASPEERARRRTLELEARGEATPYGEVLADIRKRDERDSGRSAAPLKMAEDAVLLDTTELDAQAAIAAGIAAVEAVLRSQQGQ
ncbi:MAG: (d)CMP kinase [Beijerinckiaceae bacterium]|jgi:CMP/dCMP kinase|nr:(d)CMP kinase [Beijerinckiaceae bacterium]